MTTLKELTAYELVTLVKAAEDISKLTKQLKSYITAARKLKHLKELLLILNKTNKIAHTIAVDYISLKLIHNFIGPDNAEQIRQALADLNTLKFKYCYTKTKIDSLDYKQINENDIHQQVINITTVLAFHLNNNLVSKLNKVKITIED